MVSLSRPYVNDVGRINEVSLYTSSPVMHTEIGSR